MTRHLADTAHARRDFWLCLARAFAPPAGGDYHAAFAEDLPADLDAIAGEIGLELGAQIAAFRDAAARAGDSEALQKLYAGLFLTPPAPVMINAGYYIDGGLMGATEKALNAWYGHHGFARHEHFRDLSDTVAVQCEFLSLLYDKAGTAAEADEDLEAMAYIGEAERFLAEYPRRWVTPMLRELEAAVERRDLNPAYAHLLRVLWLALEDAVTRAGSRIEKAQSADLPKGSSRGMGALTAEDLAEIAFRLERDGLAWDHVAALEGWDDAVFERRRAEAGTAMGKARTALD